MKIPVGNFGLSTPAPVSRRAPDAGGIDATARAANNIGRTIQGVAADQMQEQIRENEALARVRAGNAILDREIQTKKILEDGENYLREKKLTHDTFEDYLNSSIQKLEAPQVKGLSGADLENFTLAMRKVDESALNTGRNLGQRAKALEYKGQVDIALENFSKLASYPDADPAKVNMQIDSLDAAGRVAYGADWDLRKQNAKDSNWFNQANQRTIQAKDNLDALKQLEHDFTQKGGFYVDKLDANARNNLLRNVQNQRMQLESRLEHDSAKARNQAAVNLGKIDQQIASGIPIKPEQWQQYSAQAEGTGLESELVTRMKNEMEVQDMLRMPIEQQISFVQEKEAALKQGGDLAQAANVERMRRAVDANVKQLRESPLVFNQARTGVPVQPISLDQMGSDGVKTIFADRVASIKATQEKYGMQVKMHPLLDQEVRAITSTMDKLEPAQQGEFFGMLRKSIDDDAAYIAAMQQIAPDSPVKARAGAMIAAGGNLTLENNWFSADTAVTAQQVANTLLTGENILNKTKSQRAEDGKTKSFPIPPESNFKQAFSDAVGSVYSENPDVYETDMQAVRAYYVGKSAADGDVSGEVDSQRMDEAVRAVLGNVVTVGGGEVLTPWGMDENAFSDRFDKALVGQLKTAGASEDIISERDAFTYRNAGKGKYFVLDGRNYLLDQDGQPVVIDVIGKQLDSDKVPVR